MAPGIAREATGTPVPRSSILIKAAAVLVSCALVLSWIITFLHHHHFMSKALDLHFNQPGSFHFTLSSPAQWEVVWDLSRSSDSKEEFLNSLRTRGIVSVDEVFLPGSNSSSRTAGRTAGGAAAAGDHLDVERGAVAAAAASAGGKGDSSTPVLHRLTVPDHEGGAAATAGGGGGGERAAGKQPTPGVGPAYAKDGPLLLSADMARQQAVDGVVMVTWANHALWDFTWSWVANARSLGLENFLVGAMDAQIGAKLVGRSVPTFAMYERTQNHSGVGADHLAWGGESFHKMGRQKITLAKLFLGIKLSFLLIDVDAVLLRDPLPYFAAHHQADILVTSDNLMSTTKPGDTGLEWPALAGAPMNIGFMFIRYGAATVAFVDHWLDSILHHDKLWDQVAFNELARAGWDPVAKVHADDARVFLGYNGTLGVGILPVAMFAGGHTYFIQKLYEIQEVAPYAVHCTFQMGGNLGKRNRMREAMIFVEEPEYYTGDKYVSMDLARVPNLSTADFMLKNATQMKEFQRLGLLMQMEPVWPAMAIATVFDRAIILPKVACYCDRYWMDLDKCRIPGANTQRIPFLCPGDHVLAPDYIVDDASKVVPRYREHSFLENPRCPSEVKRSKLTIYTCKECTVAREKYVVQEGGRVLLLPPALTEAQLLLALTPFADVRVWHFRDPTALWKGQWNDWAHGAEFDKRAQHMLPEYTG